MKSELQPAEREANIVGGEDVDAAIETCGGDLRATIRALLIGTAFLEQALEEARQEASWGYIRARPSRREREAAEG